MTVLSYHMKKNDCDFIVFVSEICFVKLVLLSREVSDEDSVAIQIAVMAENTFCFDPLHFKAISKSLW